ncbi:ribosome maturation factor RimP [Ferroacidibacillus organovorans]|uniref:Ribosome maturation factor RimP n=1 Tax=Ferroacidibacillus organovorans TaxID=1765683 RepID=A0A101XP59_9BACL|nr:ribosome maturation factor RimP [Ferroacidibacillus organovorans]KUO95039.1 hypothetical protein ATW55_11205 [Ferroacidibacillus organovorans]
MARQKVTDLVERLVAPVLRENGLELVETEYKKEGANWMLRVFIDRPQGAVDLDDCAKVSESLSILLDESDPIPNAYFLEVSSAGAERPLRKPRDFERAVGKRVYLSFYEPYLGHKEVEGTLLSFVDETLEIEVNDQRLPVLLDKVASARLSIVW